MFPVRIALLLNYFFGSFFRVLFCTEVCSGYTLFNNFHPLDYSLLYTPRFFPVLVCQFNILESSAIRQWSYCCGIVAPKDLCLALEKGSLAFFHAQPATSLSDGNKCSGKSKERRQLIWRFLIVALVLVSWCSTFTAPENIAFWLTVKLRSMNSCSWLLEGPCFYRTAIQAMFPLSFVTLQMIIFM